MKNGGVVEESAAAADVLTRSLLRGLAHTADLGLLSSDAARDAAESVALSVLQDALAGVPDQDRWELLTPRAELLSAFIGELS